MTFEFIKNSLLKIEKYQEKIYLLTIIISISTMIISNSILVIDSVYSFASSLYFILKIVRYASYIVFAFLIFIDYINGKCKRKIVLFILFIGILSTIFSRDFQIFSYILIILAAVNVDINKIFKVYLWVHLTMIVTFVFLSSTGLIQNVVFDLGVRNRNTLGFSWTTVSPMLFFFIICNIGYLNQKKITVLEILLLFFSSVLIYILTDSRFIFLMQLLVLMFIMVYRFNSNFIKGLLESKVIKNIIMIFPFVICIFSFFIQFLYDSSNSLHLFLNQLLSGRLELGHAALMEYGLSLFGKNIEWVGFGVGADPTKVYNYVDCSYVQILLSYGIIILLIVIFAYFLIIKQAYVKKDYMFILIILSILILNITEPRLINIIYNPFIISASFFLKNNTRNLLDKFIHNS